MPESVSKPARIFRALVASTHRNHLLHVRVTQNCRISLFASSTDGDRSQRARHFACHDQPMAAARSLDACSDFAVVELPERCGSQNGVTYTRCGRLARKPPSSSAPSEHQPETLLNAMPARKLGISTHALFAVPPSSAANGRFSTVMVTAFSAQASVTAIEKHIRFDSVR